MRLEDKRAAKRRLVRTWYSEFQLRWWWSSWLVENRILNMVKTTQTPFLAVWKSNQTSLSLGCVGTQPPLWRSGYVPPADWTPHYFHFPLLLTVWKTYSAPSPGSEIHLDFEPPSPTEWALSLPPGWVGSQAPHQ